MPKHVFKFKKLSRVFQMCHFVIANKKLWKNNICAKSEVTSNLSSSSSSSIITYNYYTLVIADMRDQGIV